jgi:hypothetical protein
MDPQRALWGTLRSTVAHSPHKHMRQDQKKQHGSGHTSQGKNEGQIHLQGASVNGAEYSSTRWAADWMLCDAISLGTTVILGLPSALHGITLAGSRGKSDRNRPMAPSKPLRATLAAGSAMQASLGATYGYARVSTIDQDLGIQRAALKAAGCEIVREEKASGTKRDGRTELATLLDFLRPGDTLVVTRIDRLARSVKDLQDVVHELRAKGVTLKATEQPIDTSTAAGKAFLDMLGVFAELRPTFGASASSRGSARRRSVASIRAVSRRLTRPRSAG